MSSKPRFISSLAEQRKKNAEALRVARQTKKLTEIFHEVFIARLFLIKPRQVTTSTELAWLEDLILFRQCVRDSSFRSVSKGWYITGSGTSYSATYGMTPSRIARLDVLIESLSRRKEELIEAEKLAIQTNRRASQTTKDFEASEHDPHLAARLDLALGSAQEAAGYVYFKKWELNNGTCWYKIGITSDPNRRDSEQNVMPVPVQTICCIRVSSMEKARLIESTVHDLLSAHQIKGASNRELFELSNRQASSVRRALENLRQE
jgi:hypothetical protein